MAKHLFFYDSDPFSGESVLRERLCRSFRCSDLRCRDAAFRDTRSALFEVARDYGCGLLLTVPQILTVEECDAVFDFVRSRVGLRFPDAKLFMNVEQHSTNRIHCHIGLFSKDSSSLKNFLLRDVMPLIQSRCGLGQYSTPHLTVRASHVVASYVIKGADLRRRGASVSSVATHAALNRGRVLRRSTQNLFRAVGPDRISGKRAAVRASWDRSAAYARAVELVGSKVADGIFRSRASLSECVFRVVLVLVRLGHRRPVVSQPAVSGSSAVGVPSIPVRYPLRT